MRWSWWSTLSQICFYVAASTTHAAERPNIVFLFSDDHAYQAISAYGDPRKLIETPNLDRIAQGGMRFDRCLVTNSICGPSRACILTGKYSHKNGFYNNTNSVFDNRQVTFPKLLRQAGYQTAVIGKWHLMSDPTGFDEWQILPGQGIYYNPPMIHNGQRVKHSGYVTDLITDFSIEWLKQRDPNKPFLLMCQHKAPHREWSPALRHLGHHGGAPFAEPANLLEDYSGRGLAVRDQEMTLEKTFSDTDVKFKSPGSMTPEQKQAWDAYYEPLNREFHRRNLSGNDLVRWRYQRYMHDYLGCVKAVDEGVGRILDYLDESGLSDNTIVVYCSDQGFFLGEHGWYDKRWIFEESARTPLLVRWPRVTRPGSVCSALVSNVDFAETFLEAAGVEIPKEMQGVSLVPILKGETPGSWRQSFYYHYYEYPSPHHVRPHEGVITDQYKLVRVYAPEEPYFELYDRRTDPQEMKNVYGDAAYTEIATSLTKELAKLRTELEVPEVTPPQAFGNDPLR